MIAFGVCPVYNVVDIHLHDLLDMFVAKLARVVIPALNQLAHCMPSFAPIFCAPAFPMGAFVASHPVAGVVLTGSQLELFHEFGRAGATWVEFGVPLAISKIAILSAEQPVGVARSAGMRLVTLGANNVNLPTAPSDFAQLAGTTT